MRFISASPHRRPTLMPSRQQMRERERFRKRELKMSLIDVAHQFLPCLAEDWSARR